MINVFGGGFEEALGDLLGHVWEVSGASLGYV